MEQVVARPAHDAQQRRHRGDLLDLLLEVPLHELLAEVVALVAGGAGEQGDLVGDAPLLVEHQLDDVLDRLEVVADLVDAGDADLHVVVEQVLDHAHRVVALLEGLPVEVGGQLGQVLVVAVHGDRGVLLRRRELVPDLVAEELVERRRGIAHTRRV